MRDATVLMSISLKQPPEHCVEREANSGVNVGGDDERQQLQLHRTMMDASGSLTEPQNQISVRSNPSRRGGGGGPCGRATAA